MFLYLTILLKNLDGVAYLSGFTSTAVDLNLNKISFILSIFPEHIPLHI